MTGAGIDLGGGTIATMPASGLSPIDGEAWNVFAPLYRSLTLGVEGAVTNDINMMIQEVTDFFVPMCTLGVLLLMLVDAAAGSNHSLSRFSGYLIRAGIVMSLVHEGGHYVDWVVQPITSLPDHLVAALNGVNAGEPGHSYDVIAAHYTAGLANVAANLPFDGPKTAIISAVVLVVLFAICLPLCLLALLVSFAVYVAYKLFLYPGLVIGPVMIAVAMAGPLRGWTQGFVNAMGSLIIGMVLNGVILTFTLAAVDVQTQSLINLPAGVNIMSSLGHAFMSIVCMIIGAAMSLLSRSISVGIVGGIYPSLQPFATAMRGAMVAGGSVGSGISSVASAVSGGGSSTGMATASMAIPRAAP